LWCSLILAASGIFAFALHGILLLQGGIEFRAPVSILLLAATGAVSVAQLAAAAMALRRERVRD
jgi:hypothetical protein